MISYEVCDKYIFHACTCVLYIIVGVESICYCYCLNFTHRHKCHLLCHNVIFRMNISEGSVVGTLILKI